MQSLRLSVPTVFDFCDLFFYSRSAFEFKLSLPLPGWSWWMESNADLFLVPTPGIFSKAQLPFCSSVDYSVIHHPQSALIFFKTSFKEFCKPTIRILLTTQSTLLQKGNLTFEKLHCVQDEEPLGSNNWCSVALENSFDQKLSSHFLIYKKLDPVPRVNSCPGGGFCCCVKLDSSYQVSKIAEICKGNQQGALEKQIDPGRLTGILATEVLLHEQGQQTVAIYPVKLFVFIVRGNVTWREIIT